MVATAEGCLPDLPNEFQGSQDYVEKPCLKNTNNKTKQSASDLKLGECFMHRPYQECSWSRHTIFKAFNLLSRHPNDGQSHLIALLHPLPPHSPVSSGFISERKNFVRGPGMMVVRTESLSYQQSVGPKLTYTWICYFFF